ncbi:unnamed protein product, partial [Polarella glacialis]
FAHASPMIKDSQAEQGWTSDMQVQYQCDVGYKGDPYAECGSDGIWKFAHDSCQLIGCGALETFLTKSASEGWFKDWRDVMRMTEQHDLTSSHAGEVVSFSCEPGYHGAPVAVCHEGGEWFMTDECVPFETTSGCRCQAKWVLCDGWLQTGCKEWYGCKAASSASPESYDWCEVEAGSCPSHARDLFGSEPPWDYCVNDNFNIAWKPMDVPDRGDST